MLDPAVQEDVNLLIMEECAELRSDMRAQRAQRARTSSDDDEDGFVRAAEEWDALNGSPPPSPGGMRAEMRAQNRALGADGFSPHVFDA